MSTDPADDSLLGNVNDCVLEGGSRLHSKLTRNELSDVGKIRKCLIVETLDVVDSCRGMVLEPMSEMWILPFL